MDEIDEASQRASELCKSCGLCCTGHLFIWVKLRPAELDPAEALGMPVLRADPRQRGFNQPCSLWDGVCSIYTSPHYPHACRAYKCKQFKAVLSGEAALDGAQGVIQQVMGLIAEVENLLPASTMPNFRERVVAHFEALQGRSILSAGEQVYMQKAQKLLDLYEQEFGVNDLLADF